MTKKQEKEIERRMILTHISHSSECKVCGFDFLFADDYKVDGIDYPIITNYWQHEGVENWTENHMCPNCKIPYQYHDGT